MPLESSQPAGLLRTPGAKEDSGGLSELAGVLLPQDGCRETGVGVHLVPTSASRREGFG